MNRYTMQDVQHKIDTVRNIAARAGLVTLTYGGSTFDSLHAYQAYETVWLKASRPGESGSEDVCNARGVREVCRHLDGMIAVLDAVARHND